MALFLVRRKDRAGYDEYSAMVVRARDAREAAAVADAFATENDPHAWTADHNVTVEFLPETGAPTVVLGSFHSG